MRNGIWDGKGIGFRRRKGRWDGKGTYKGERRMDTVMEGYEE